MKKIVTVIGARPQFIKSVPISKVIRNDFQEILVHTGQHYDERMAEIFFKELEISEPDYCLNIGSGTHGEQTGKMLSSIEKVLLDEKPQALIVYGDTNSTIAGALSASKLLIPVIHIEAGLRSYNMKMPEEQNRILTDRLSSILFCPNDSAIRNLALEGIKENIHNVGDVMYDSVLVNTVIAEQNSSILKDLSLKSKEFILATIHRAENTDVREVLESIIAAMNESGENIVFPLHPRTKKYIEGYGLVLADNIKVIEPVGYFDMLVLEKHAKKVVSDSGGVQKEAFFLDTPCIIARNETEWTELVDMGYNILAGVDFEKLLKFIKHFSGNPHKAKKDIYGDGHAAQKICDIIKNNRLLR